MQKKISGSTITVPVPDHKEIKIGTLKSIVRQSQLPVTNANALVDQIDKGVRFSKCVLAIELPRFLRHREVSEGRRHLSLTSSWQFAALLDARRSGDPD